ncbi:ribose transporter RbsU [Lactobacillus sp. S2-2]|uniref:ribose/proton symporter RbsU n=1 Tax=Lactobacillus sp. S2-2 TaxID=2692917 RepID=UPI001F297EED|nr:GRP family sugar transporter [Lactobacillus sp. S2-2]MCF6515428.1 ribose transporter RbsU [Lactobacillus sp. S2-2]
MNLFAILIGLCPMIGWGLFPTISSKFGGKPINGVFGAAFGSLIFAIILVLVAKIPLPGGFAFFLAVLSGFSWGIGSIMQFKGFKLVGSSRVMPVSTAFQLILTSCWGVFVLGNWTGTTGKIIGFIALIAIIIGATLTSWTENKEESDSGKLKKAIMYQFIGALGFLVYSALPQLVTMPSVQKLVPNMGSMSGMQAFLPQALGMVIFVIVYNLMNLKDGNIFAEKVSYLQIFAGLSQGFGMLMYLISAQPDMNGLATAFIIGQMAVIVSTLTGIYVLKQRKTPKELALTFAGLIIIVLGASVTVFI